ncbi:undecaprenyl-phosphate alpha-N-acetylglucosaminyl 1-phosphate transferase [Virgibacillus phasianinus]|uniref:Undecaprenyl-phosphate alpha-N-acetylglucosaminyl 1-phosphate transferase n=1 Tax=Virgibacillus phasianinus TaxID=2017483 RepID=A0A220U258_9BACI|nr:MraY family glycosyltransferase [Virgibacillus phasianinus]ASK62135.1 undecaprenyl-phosphate alpha-N-acetylglucosaminyl 1-phosphate transferase [Virgibacillus phasianinus]
MEYFALVVCFIVSLIMTPFVKKLAIRVGAVDQPNARKIHKNVMPRLGGLAIILSSLLGIVLFMPEPTTAWPIISGAIIITAVGVLDDLLELPAKVKLSGQVLAAIVSVAGGIQIEFITIPFGEKIEFDYLVSIPLTIIWIVGVTNAINLIDGLDGLAAGVSSIALLTISGMAISMGSTFVAIVGLIVLGSTLGFLFYNFHPAKIFMGDTGALFLGYMISVLAVVGLFKNVTIFSLIVPIIILGVPLLDTTFAIVRRMLKRQPLATADKFHLHHCLINLGYSHRQTVILIYAMSGYFSIAAIIFTRATLWGSTLVIVGLLITIELIVEVTGLIGENYRPVLRFMQGTKLKK